MIKVKNLSKKYSDSYAVDNVSFEVKKGEILGFLGPNGAGKSTTMNIITGYLSASDGEVFVDGIDVALEPIKAKKKIGYLPEIPPLYVDMTVNEYLEFMYDLKKIKLDKTQHIKEIASLVKILDVSNRLIKNLSKGYKQRVGIAQAMLGNPEVLILDEPTVGLDPRQIIDIRNLIKNLSEKHTVIISSHILPEVQAICERVVVINRGKIVADDTPDNLSSKLSSDHRLIIRVEGEEDKIFTTLRTIDKIVDIQKLGVREDGKAFEFKIESRDNADIRKEVFWACSEAGLPILSQKSAELTLEDIFLQLTSALYTGSEK